MKKNILIVNWGTETAKYVIGEINKLPGYNIYLACTNELSAEISDFFSSEKIICTNPYDKNLLCEDVDKFIKNRKIKFEVVTTFFEMCVYQTSFLAEYLGIRNRLPVDAAVKTSVNKYLMRKELEKNRIRQPKFVKFKTETLKQAFDFFKKLKTDAVIKPVHSGHSYGVRFLKNKSNFDDFLKVFEEAKKDLTKNYDEWMKYEKVEEREFLMEEYIEGKIFSFDGIVSNKNEIDFIGSVEFELSDLPVLNQIGNTIPIYSLTEKQINSGRKYISEVVKILGLEYCGFHGEVKFKEEEPYLIEISGRLPGGTVLKSYQNISEDNVFDKFLKVFDDKKTNKYIKNKNVFVGETFKIIYSNKNRGIVKNSPKVLKNNLEDYSFSIRSRKEEEEICEPDKHFGVWLYEITVRTKKMSMKRLVEKRDKIISEQKIKVYNNVFSIMTSCFNSIKKFLN